MTLFTAVFSATLVFLAGPEALAEKVEVRVRLKKELSRLEISGLGVRIFSDSPSVAVTAGSGGVVTAKINRTQEGQWTILWQNEANRQRLDGEKLAIRGQFLRLGSEPVPYELEVVSNPKRGLDVVARLDLETYLAGVLPAEMPISWSLEALKAQAVAARSYVLSMARERRERHYDVDSTIIDQVYKFLHEVEDDPAMKKKLNRALQETRGQVLADTRGQILRAFYSADCGCQSEDPKFVWGKLDSFVSVKDPTCSRRKPLTWQVIFNRVDVRANLITALELPLKANLKAIHVAGRTPSGRVAEVVASLNFDGKTRVHTLSAQEFRKIFGYQKIRSNDFSLQWLGDELHIRGTGAGHGVGLCQTGARALADEGLGFKEILKFYYPKAKLKNLNIVES